ncbi:MAG: hypothetical protein CMB80_30610 [Flammeovirgaceae bacterium]|nr:hypothetical protein [Flammeovirgaceae bacterium]MBR08780.1 hypothetical protein [Rickettsiales bacterium]HCX23290.1 hypothetical protein [Cytophagales bacterium]|tara:strand:- start:186 stop:494 length:309 start_codon:yes stop_codon:yes gene_type:complete
MILTNGLKASTAEKEVSRDLINGEFNAKEAAEIINHLFRTKINFHGRKNFSSQIRFGATNEDSLERIKELKHSQNEIAELVELAKVNHFNLRISSTISIELV